MSGPPCWPWATPAQDFDMVGGGGGLYSRKLSGIRSTRNTRNTGRRKKVKAERWREKKCEGCVRACEDRADVHVEVDVECRGLLDGQANLEESERSGPGCLCGHPGAAKEIARVWLCLFRDRITGMKCAQDQRLAGQSFSKTTRPSGQAAKSSST